MQFVHRKKFPVFLLPKICVNAKMSEKREPGSYVGKKSNLLLVT